MKISDGRGATSTKQRWKTGIAMESNFQSVQKEKANLIRAAVEDILKSRDFIILQIYFVVLEKTGMKSF